MFYFLDPETQASYAHNGKLMLALAILLFLLILTIILLHTYRHSCFRRRRRHHHRIRTNPTTAINKDIGLHPSLLNILPTFTYSTTNHHPLHDCAICLSEFDDGDEGRVFPNCNHAFHSHCIEAWLRSHSSCPLCRTPVHQYAAPVQPPQTPSFDIEPGPIGCSSFPAPIGCPRNPLELVGIIVEMEDERLRRSEAGSAYVTGYHGLKGFRQ